MTNLDSLLFYDQPRQLIKNQRHYFANKGPLVKAMVFPVVMYGCENWTIRKAEHSSVGDRKNKRKAGPGKGHKRNL